jgi:hypothetical protein
MNRVSNEYNIPFRCVTQWATHQTGKLYDTLGVKLESQNSNELSLVALAPNPLRRVNQNLLQLANG